MLKEKSNRLIFIALLIFIAHLSLNTLFRSRAFVNWDGPQFAISTVNYSVQEYFPGLPGHFLYVMAAKFLNFFFNERFLSLVSLSIIFSALISAGLFFIGSRIFSVKTGLLAALFYMSSPLFLFYGTTITPLMMSGFFSLLCGYCFYRVIYGRQYRYLIWGSVSYGILIGIRPQEILFIFPFWLWAFLKADNKTKVLSFSSLSLIFLGWFMPFSYISGGLNELILFFRKEISSGATRLSASVFTMPSLLKANLKYQVYTYAITFGPAVLAFFYYLPQFFCLKNICASRKAQAFIVWIIPSLLFWSVYNFSTPGYIIVSLLPMFILLAEFLVTISRELSDILAVRWKYFSNKSAGIFIFMPIFLAVNLFVYFYDFNPAGKGTDYDSFRAYSDIRKRDTQILEKIRYIKENVPAENSIVVVSSSFFMPLMYYLPQYHVYLFNGVFFKGNNLVRYGHNFERRNFSDFNSKDLIRDKGIRKIVFFDDEFSRWVDTGAGKENIAITGRYSLLVVSPERDAQLIYGYKSIRIRE